MVGDDDERAPGIFALGSCQVKIPGATLKAGGALPEAMRHLLGCNDMD
jgi:hypothetical protein